jgi:hypothetical protein
VLAGGVVLASTSDGEPVQDVRLLSGAAWLTSSTVGQVTLLDGSSAEVAAQVQVAPAGTNLDVAQQGATAFAINQSAGTVRRVDGATFALSQPEAPIPDASGGLAVFPGPDVLYTVDSRHGVLAGTDPRTLARRGELMSLASELAAGSAVVDGAGSLWAVDAKTGDLTYVLNGKRNVRRQVVQPGRSKLAMSGGHPVVIDVDRRKAVKIDRANGRPGATVELDLRATDTVEVSGSVHSPRLYVVAGRGVLTVCDLSEDTCDNTIPLNAGSTFGQAVEAGNQVFVPDYTTGQVWIIDLAQSRVVAKPTVLTPPVPFQLFARDGVVFYNDTNSERAGVIQLDGSVVNAAKYDPKNPAKGLTGDLRGTQIQKPDQSDRSGQSGRSDRSDQPDQSVAQTTQPGLPTSRNQPGQPNQPTGPNQPGETRQPGQPSGSLGPDLPDPSTAPPSTSDTTSPSTTPPPSEPRLAISMSNTAPTEGQPVTLQVANTNGDAPESAQWTFGDGGVGSGVTTSHRWAAARPTPYLVTVTATLPDGRQATTSVNVTVSETPRVRLTVSIPGGGGSVSGGGISCPGTCSVDLQPDTQITLTAQPDATHQLGQWGGACSGGGNTCDVTVDVAKTVSRTFEARPASKVTLSIASPANGRVNHTSGSCPSACQLQFDQNDQVQLIAVPNSGFRFGSWGGVCSGQGATCVFTITGNMSVSASFPQIEMSVITSLECDTIGKTNFFCDVAATPAGVQIRWTVNTIPVNGANDRTHMSSGCDQNRNATIRVVVSNVRGSDEAQDSVRCEGNF